MIDFIKSIGCLVGIDKILKNEYLEFESFVKNKTGEIHKQVAKYQDIKFEIIDNKYFNLKGSLHKYSNNGLHNHNDFLFKDLLNVIIDLYKKFDLNPYHVPINNIEFGVNITTSKPPKDIIKKNIINYKSKEASIKTYNGKGYFKEFEKSRYYVKIYDKGLQFKKNSNIFRFEIKVIKMEHLKNIGIKNLTDLLNIDKLKSLGTLLIKTFNELLMYDNSIKHDNLNTKEKEILLNGTNQAYWSNLKPNSKDYDNGNKNKQYKKDRKKFYFKLNEFKKIINDYNAEKIKKEISNKIEKKLSKILSVDEKTKDKLTNFINLFNRQNYKLIDNSKQSNNDIKEQINISNIKTICTNKELKQCIVTKLDISMQKKDSKFLCISGLNYYKINNHKIYNKLKKRLSKKWINKSDKIKNIEIAHSIRNEYNNKFHNNKRDINKLITIPSLFNNIDLIDKKRLQLIGM